MHLVGKGGCRAEVYTQNCLKIFSETTIKLALFSSLLVPRFFIEKIVFNNQNGCMHILCEACNIKYE